MNIKLMAFLAVLLNVNNAYSQLIENGDFIGGSNSLIYCDNDNFTGRSQYGISNIPNWDYTHGTPNLCQNQYGCPDPDAILMTDHKMKGEGIVGGYRFKAGETYTIHLGINSVLNPKSVYMVAGNGAWPKSNACYEICYWPNVLNGKTPIDFTHNEEWVLQPRAGKGLSTLNVGDNVFSFTPIRDQDWISMFPYGDVDEECPHTEVVVDYIYINRNCKESKSIGYFPNNANWFGKEPYLTQFYKKINVGSIYDSYSLAENRGQSVSIHASEYISVVPNTLFTAEFGRVNLVIDKYMCDYFPENMGNNGNTGSKNTDFTDTDYSFLNTSVIGKENTSNNNFQTSKLTIHPNPTTGQLNITMPAPGDYEVKISNMLGVVVYQGKLKDEQQKQIQLENSLPSGNYTVQITGKDINHIEKITLTR